MIERRWTFPAGARIDVVLPDGTHRYWSTHCRHAPLPRAKKCDEGETDGHDACTAIELAPGVPRQSAQCKTCAAPCICPCHEAMSEADVREMGTACTCDGGSLHEVWCAKVQARLG